MPRTMMRQQQALMQRMAAQKRGLRAPPPVQNVTVPNEYKPPPVQKVTVQNERKTPPMEVEDAPAASETNDRRAIVDRIDAYGATVAKVEKRQFRVWGTPTFDIPMYVEVPRTIEELRRGSKVTGNKITKNEDGEYDPVLLYHPNMEGVNGIVFMMHPVCDTTSGGIMARYVPIGLSNPTNLAKDELGAGDEKAFFQNFKVA
jgi:hypothetical protein